MLSKTPKEDNAKTESAPKSKARYVYLIVFVILCAAGGIYALATDQNEPIQLVNQTWDTNPNLETKTLIAKETSVTAEVAQDSGAQQLGLSNRNCIASDHAMLFTYALTGDYCYWMKDMNFPIDMIWLDDEKKIVTIHANVSPDTYPQTFCPDRPAQYVVEVRAGKAKASNWNTGTQFSF